LHAGNLEFEPVALFEVVHPAIERQEKFKRVLVGYWAPSYYIISGSDTHIAGQIQGDIFARHFCTKKGRWINVLGFAQNS
ncbi:MAG: hypothetical protein ACREDV_09805, partial [Methylocella sp.]